MSRFISIFTFLYLLQAACWAAPQSARAGAVLEANGTVLLVTNGTRIIGGRPSTIEKYAFAVQVNQNNQLICGGSLVSRRCVLSAAHCFVDRDNLQPNPSLYSVRIGTSNLNVGGSVHRVTTIVVHPQYNTVTHESDVAVMVLRANVTLGSTVRLAPLPLQASFIPDNATLVHIGWGRTQVNSPNLASVLNEVEVRKVNQTTCRLRYMQLGHLVTSNMICAGLLDVGGADACQGDSGGPLLYHGLVVGITSWGHGCGDPTYPGVSARVANYSAWINTQITRYNGSPALSALNALVLVSSLAASLIVLK